MAVVSFDGASRTVGVVQLDPTPFADPDYEVQATNVLAQLDKLVKTAHDDSCSRPDRDSTENGCFPKWMALKTTGTALDLVVFPEWMVGLSANMKAYENTSTCCWCCSRRERKRNLFAKIVEDVCKTYELQINYCKNICRKFGCSVVLSLFAVEEGKVFTQAVCLEGGSGRVLAKCNKIHPWLSFVSAGDKHQVCVMELRRNIPHDSDLDSLLDGAGGVEKGEKEGRESARGERSRHNRYQGEEDTSPSHVHRGDDSRQLALAICYDVLKPCGFWKHPREGLMKRLLGGESPEQSFGGEQESPTKGERDAERGPLLASDGGASDVVGLDGAARRAGPIVAPPIVACPYAMPPVLSGFAAWRMKRWGTVGLGGEARGSKKTAITNLVMLGANCFGGSCIVDQNGEKHWFGGKSGGGVQIDGGGRMFWRTV